MVLLGRVDSIVIKVLELQRVIAHVIHFELVWARCLLDSNLEREFVSARLGGVGVFCNETTSSTSGSLGSLGVPGTLQNCELSKYRVYFHIFPRASRSRSRCGSAGQRNVGGCLPIILVKAPARVIVGHKVEWLVDAGRVHVACNQRAQVAAYERERIRMIFCQGLANRLG